MFPFRQPIQLALLAVGVALSACGEGPADVTVEPGEARTLPLGTGPEILQVDTLARGLTVPWGLVPTEDGGLFVAERTGRILHIAPGADSATVWATIDVYAVEEGIGPEAGLMGLALDPQAADGVALYALATTWRTAGDRDRQITTRLWRRVAGMLSPTGDLKHKNQVLRIARSGNGEATVQVIVDDLPAAYYHAGGGIAFGPDGMLYVSVGDAIRPPLSRDTRYLAGKMLRYTRDGDVPADNPVAGSPAWAWGLRNTQAFAWLPDGTLLGVEHGPSGMDQEQGRMGMDELNAIAAGNDYGWPEVAGWDVAEGITAPLWMWQEPIAPGGLALRRSAEGAWTGDILVGGLRGRLEQVTLARNGERWEVIARSAATESAFGRIRTLHSLADGRVLLTTSNRDARGAPRPGDDLVLRLTLAP